MSTDQHRSSARDRWLGLPIAWLPIASAAITATTLLGETAAERLLLVHIVMAWQETQRQRELDSHPTDAMSDRVTISVTELSARTAVTRSAAGRTLQRLVERGVLLVAEPGVGRRASVLSLRPLLEATQAINRVRSAESREATATATNDDSGALRPPEVDGKGAPKAVASTEPGHDRSHPPTADAGEGADAVASTESGCNGELASTGGGRNPTIASTQSGRSLEERSVPSSTERNGSPRAPTSAPSRAGVGSAESEGTWGDEPAPTVAPSSEHREVGTRRPGPQPGMATSSLRTPWRATVAEAGPPEIGPGRARFTLCGWRDADVGTDDRRQLNELLERLDAHGLDDALRADVLEFDARLRRDGATGAEE